MIIKLKKKKLLPLNSTHVKAVTPIVLFPLARSLVWNPQIIVAKRSHGFSPVSSTVKWFRPKFSDLVMSRINGCADSLPSFLPQSYFWVHFERSIFSIAENWRPKPTISSSRISSSTAVSEKAKKAFSQPNDFLGSGKNWQIFCARLNFQGTKMDQILHFLKEFLSFHLFFVVCRIFETFNFRDLFTKSEWENISSVNLSKLCSTFFETAF